jgi:hypothetical protein
MEPMETFEYQSVPLFGDERQASARFLEIEVRLYEEDGEVYAEPAYFKMMEGDTILMDGSHRSRHLHGQLWDFIRLTVEGEYNADVLAEIKEHHPTFAPLRREEQMQRRMDNEWYRRSVL